MLCLLSIGEIGGVGLISYICEILKHLVCREFQILEQLVVLINSCLVNHLGKIS